MGRFTDHGFRRSKVFYEKWYQITYLAFQLSILLNLGHDVEHKLVGAKHNRLRDLWILVVLHIEKRLQIINLEACFEPTEKLGPTILKGPKRTGLILDDLHA